MCSHLGVIPVLKRYLFFLHVRLAMYPSSCLTSIKDIPISSRMDTHFFVCCVQTLPFCYQLISLLQKSNCLGNIQTITDFLILDHQAMQFQTLQRREKNDV